MQTRSKSIDDDDSTTARRRDAAPRALGMRYEVERLYLTDAEGKPEQTIEMSLIEAQSAKEAAQAFIRNEGARPLGPVCEAKGDQCTATAWADGRLYVITIWRLGHPRSDEMNEPAEPN